MIFCGYYMGEETYLESFNNLMIEQVREGFKRAHKKMPEMKRQKGTPVIISENGKIIKVWPKDFDKYWPES